MPEQPWKPPEKRRLRYTPAAAAAAENKERIIREVEGLIEEIAASIEATRVALQDAPARKDTAADLAALNAEIESLSASLEQARALAAEGDYLGMERGDLPDDRTKVGDIPADYRLEFACEGKPMAISIAPLRGSGLRGLWALANGGAHRLRRMLPFFGGEAEYVVSLDRNGAQELYWALNPGNFAIIR